MNKPEVRVVPKSNDELRAVGVDIRRGKSTPERESGALVADVLISKMGRRAFNILLDTLNRQTRRQ